MDADSSGDLRTDDPQFELIRTLGSGGGGRVRLARDLRHGGVLRALKQTGPAPPGEPSEDVERLFHEARVLRSLRHPGVPRLYDVGRLADGSAWMLMEFVPGSPDPVEPVAVARGLLDALGHLHRHGWIHHDVKPANVLVGPGGRIVLLDFGFASRVDDDVPPRGTLPFVAPEILEGEPSDARSDLWSMAAVLLSREPGVEASPSTRFGPQDVSDSASLPAEWLRCLLHPRRERRFVSAEVAWAELHTALGRPAQPLPRRPLPHAPCPVGRDSELAGLQRRLEGAVAEVDPWQASGRTALGMALVRGEPGVGKSALLVELRLRALAAGWAAHLASCAEERDSPLPAMGSVLEAVLRDAPADSAAVVRRGAAVANLVAARADRNAAETATRFLLERAAEERPLLLLVEDLQQASAQTLRMLAVLTRAISAARAGGTPPRLFVVSSLAVEGAVPEEVAEILGALETEGVVWRVPIQLLAPGDVTELVRAVLGPRSQAERVAEILRAHGGAHPLFAEELLTRLVDEGALRHEAGRWVLDERRAPRLPENLAGLVGSRLSSLPVRELRAVQILATLERPLPEAAAKPFLGADTPAILANLEAHGLVVPAQEGRSVALAHGIVGQAALGMLPRTGRARLHDHVAAVLPRQAAGSTIRRAYHLARGTDADKGLIAATGAAKRLRSEGEPGRAADFVRQALRLVPEDDPRVPHLRRSLAELLVSSGRPEAAANVFRDLLAAETDPWTRASLHSGLAEAFESSGRYAEVVASCNEALTSLAARNGAGRDPEARHLHLAVLSHLAGAQRATGELSAAIETVKSALALSEEGMAVERAALFSLLGNVYVQMGDLQRARQFHESCLAACRSAGRRRGIATAFHNLGVVHAHLGETSDAAACYRQSLRLARRSRDLTGVALTLGNLANLRAEQGDFAGAEALQLRSLELRRRLGDLRGAAVTMGNIAGIKRAHGRLGSALTLLEGAVKQLRQFGDAQGEAQFLLQAASIHLFAADHQGARPLLSRAESIARSSSLRALEARADLLWGRLERRESPAGEEWVRRLESGRKLAAAVGDRALLAEVHLEIALAERARGRRGVALREYRVAEDLLRKGANADARARADLVRGRLESDRDPGQEALAALERFHAYALSAGRRDYIPAAGLALSRARLTLGDVAGAAALLAEAQRAEEDLTASLPPALRRTREAAPPRQLIAALRSEIEESTSARTDGGPVAQAPGDDMEADRLLKLLEINKELNQAQDMRALLDRIMDIATASTGAERGFLVVVEDNHIAFQTARNFRKEEVRKPELKISKSIVQRVMKGGEAILTDNATEDTRFAEFESVDRLELKSIVSIPFRLGDQVIGALYMDNPARKGAFGGGDLQFLSALADQAALAIKNLRHSQKMAEMNQLLEQNLARKTAALETASRALSERATKYRYDRIIGRSRAIRNVLLLVDKVVETEVPVLIQGESGTGKELIAKAIHDYGKRGAGPFVPVNCGAIAETLMESELFGHAKGAFTGAIQAKKGLFEAADGGTIFLDEIGEMNLDMQKKLLRVLQEREVRPVGGKGVLRVDVRVISATNRDLRKMMEEGTFRQDLYYRIAVITVDMPPLRERADDIPMLVEHFVERAASELGLRKKPFDDEAMEVLAAHPWPGNVRELDNEVKKALTLSDDQVTADDLSIHLQGDRAGPEPQIVGIEEGATLRESLDKHEKAYIEKALERTGGNQTKAAKELGISRVWLRKKMEKHGLLGR